jgi:lysophospholipase L1-like esterase
MPMFTITAVTHDREGRIIKVRINDINREAAEITDLLLARSPRQTAVIQSGGVSVAVIAIDSAVLGRFMKTYGSRDGGPDTRLDSQPAAPMNLVTFGDSVAWGLGLKRQNKYAALVAGTLSASNRGAPVMTLNLANSGAKIGRRVAGGSGFTVSLDTKGDNKVGEVANTAITVHQQIDAFIALLQPAPASVDFILLTAGCNDIGLETILSFLKTDAEITAAVRGPLSTNMTALLRRMLSTFPNARIFVTGYYPIVTATSQPHNWIELGLAIQYLTKSTPSPAAVTSGVALANLIRNCKSFADEYELALNTIVDGINATTPHRERLFFSRPEFAPRHTLFGLPRRSRLWRLKGTGFVTDETAHVRGPLCDDAYGPGSGDSQACRGSSVGHPNVKGAKAYFRAIRDDL